MKKCISFLLTIFICFNFIFITCGFKYEVKAESYQEVNSNTRNIKYIAVFIKFKDTTNNESNIDSDTTNNKSHIDDDECVKNANTIFNSEETFSMQTEKGNIQVPSFKKYYEMQSYGKLSITTEIFPRENGKVVAYEDSNEIGYYLKYNEENKIGYKSSAEAIKRETELVSNAVEYVATQIEEADIKQSEIDTDSDGIVDAISFFVEGQENLPSSIEWGDLLWAHKSGSNNIIGQILDKKVSPYNLIYVSDYKQSVGAFSLDRGTYGTIIHEFGHTLGYKDLYRYGSQNKPVGFYDIMGNVIGSNPQNLLTYFTTDYTKETTWHKPLPVISKTTNNITLYKPEFKDDNEMRAIKLKQYAESEEYFIIEYHEKQNTYNTHSADESGIIVYRVNEKNKYVGNAIGGNHGENDHIFVFRPNESGLGNGEGDLTKATLNNTRTVLGKKVDNKNNAFDNKTIYYSDGSNSGIVITVTSQTDKSVTFNVTFPKVQGEGTKDSPCLIYDVDTFLYLMGTETKNKYYKLMNDLDFSNIKNYPKIDFYGNLDGNNKTLKNISAVGTGVFNNIGYNNTKTVIENLNVQNINISPDTGNYLGGFASATDNVTLKNIHLKSGSVKNVKHAYIDSCSTGGFIGNVNNNTIIDNCSSSLNVSSEKNVGGFVGINSNATIKNSYANGTISGNANVGGFIGLQNITDTTYKVPQNVYFDYSKTKISNAVGSYVKSIHNLVTLPENQLGKGIVGISVTKEINMNKVKEVSYNIETNPKTTLPFSITSSDSTIAKYSNNKIQALKNGTANIYADLKVGTQVMRLESKVNVSNITIPITTININSITLNKSSISLTEKEVVQLNATLSPSNHTMSKIIKWTSSNSTVASVDNTGKVTANLAGTATITATAVNGKTAKCTVTVKKKVVPISESEVLKHFGLTKKDGYVVGFKVGSSVANIKKLLSSYQNVTLSSFQNSSGKEISTGTIATNMKFTLTFNQKQYSYVIVIKGDVNGDGLIYATDYVKIKNHIMGKQKLTGAYLKAADINNDNNIYATDYVRIKKYIMGTGTIEQK